MNVLEHLLTCLGEEGCEVSQATAKSKRFGLDDVNVLEPTGPTNRQRIVAELNDLLAVADMLVDEHVFPADWQNRKAQQAKKEKVRKFMRYARMKGTLE